MKKKYQDRFWEYVNVLGPDDCWFWKRCLGAGGYGRFWNGQKLVTASRCALELAIGRELTPGMSALHGCEARYAPGDTSYRKCCNPRHLREGTHADNERDMVEAGRAGYHKIRRRHTSDQKMQAIEALWASGKSRIEIKRTVGVSTETIGKVVERAFPDAIPGKRNGYHPVLAKRSISPEQLDKAREKRAAGLTMVQLAMEMGVSESTLRRHMNNRMPWQRG